MPPRLVAGEFVSTLRPHRPENMDGKVVRGEDGVPRVIVSVTLNVNVPAGSLPALAMYAEWQANTWQPDLDLDWSYSANGEDEGVDEPVASFTEATRLALHAIENVAQWFHQIEIVPCACDAAGRRCTHAIHRRAGLSLARAILSIVLMKLAESSWFPLPLLTREALLAALIARNAAIEGNTETVNDFSRTWLGLEHPERWREAVEMALLGGWVGQLGTGIADDSVVTDLLRRHCHSEHEQLQPLWERRIRGKRVALLSCPIGDGLALADVLTDPRSPEKALLDGQFSDDRIDSVLRQLQAQEEDLALQQRGTGRASGYCMVRQSGRV
ncbi:hypothetical protein [Streptomyces sp. NPDC012510]|uniref:hypothetical protein n=1 Tax=Streptomyces sp. NPDC012510 TaxID=3364838 RepID=UPI0036E5B459